ncbi:PriCT-2 domain-containing protein, partial [Acidithiobacillus ferridurans]|uniref:PriCT-2 domain-containing protein n=1 Tax=Acidithiobacillus ferridurans TaxID=1232575 RepID=UPI0021F89291
MKNGFGEGGFEIWREWSQSVPGGDSTGVLRAKWDGLNVRAVTLGTLFHYAKLYGWVAPEPDKHAHLRPWRTAENAAAGAAAVPVDTARVALKTGLQEMVGGYLDYLKSRDEEKVFSPWLFSPSMGVGKSTAVKGLQKNVDLRLSGGRVVVAVPDHAQAQEYENAGFWHFWGRQAQVNEDSPSATQKDALCQNHAQLMQAVETGHVPQAEFCRRCSHGLSWAIQDAERQINEDNCSDHRAGILRERIAHHKQILRSRGLDPATVEPCKWQDHLRVARDQQFVVMVSQSYSHSLVGDALYIADERFETGKPVAVGMPDIDKWAKRNLQDLEKAKAAPEPDMEHVAMLENADGFFKSLAQNLATWPGRTGAIHMDGSLLTAVQGMLESAKQIAGARGVEVELARWESLSFDASGNLSDSPLRAAFAIAETLEHDSGYVENGMLRVAASNPVIERIATGLPVCVMDATPDPVIQSIITAKGGRIVHALAEQKVHVVRHPTRFWGLKTLNPKKVTQVRVERELEKYRAAIQHHESLHGADTVAFLMHKRAHDALWPDPDTAPENVGYWGRDHRAHDRWTGKHLVLLGSFFPPLDAWRSTYQSDRIAALAAGCDPADWPVWADDMEMVQGEWVSEGTHEVQSRLPLPAAVQIRAWLLQTVTAETVQALGRARGANLASPVDVHIYGGVPLAGLGAYGLEVAEYAADNAELGAVKMIADAEARASGIAVLDMAASRVIAAGGTITRAALEAKIMLQANGTDGRFEAEKGLCRQGIKPSSLPAQTP